MLLTMESKTAAHHKLENRKAPTTRLLRAGSEHVGPGQAATD